MYQLFQQTRPLVKILIVAAAFRLVLMLIQFYGINLPHAGADTVKFERVAFEYYAENKTFTFKELLNNGVNLHTYIGSQLYKVFGRFPLIWSLCFLLLGLGSIYFIYKTVLLIGSEKQAKIAGWLACFYPNLAIFSVVLLREIYVIFFLSVASYFFIKQIHSKNNLFLIPTIAFGVFASLFHSAIYSFVFGVLMYYIFLAKNFKFSIKILVSIFAIIFVLFINETGLGLDKVGGSMTKAFELAISGGGAVNKNAEANYSSWLMLTGGLIDLVLIPIRIFAFLFAPFIPFFPRTLAHILGVLDGIFYFIIFYNIIKNWKYHKASAYSKGLLIIIMTVVFAFSLGASNFGTNIRHRTKILPVILMIPLFVKNEKIFFKNNNK